MENQYVPRYPLTKPEPAPLDDSLKMMFLSNVLRKMQDQGMGIDQGLVRGSVQVFPHLRTLTFSVYGKEDTYDVTVFPDHSVTMTTRTEPKITYAWRSGVYDDEDVLACIQQIHLNFPEFLGTEWYFLSTARVIQQ